MRKAILAIAAAAAAATAVTLSAQAEQPHGHDMQGMHPGGESPMADTRTLVHFPPQLRVHTLANMRDHLLSLQEIQAALADGRFDQAGDIAEQRLGMSSLPRHGAHEVAQYMPEAMREAGTQMHRSASRFAVEARNAAVGGDVRPALAALAKVTQSCVACHAGFRLQ